MQNHDVLEELVRKAAEGAKGKPTKPESPEPQEQADARPENSRLMDTKSLDVSVTDRIPVPVADDKEKQKQKMAQIRESLAMLNKEDAKPEEKPAYKPKHAAETGELPPLTKHDAQKRREENAAAVTAQTDPAANRAAAAKAKKAQGAPESAAVPKKKKKKKPQNAKAAAAAPSGKSRKAHKSAKPLTFGGLSTGLVAAVAGGSVLIAMIASYVIVAGTYQGKFLPNTYINAVEVAGLTTDEAEDALLENAQERDITLTDHNGQEVVFKAADFDAHYTIPEGAFTEASGENPYAWVGKLFGASEYKVDYDFSYSDEKLRALIAAHDWGSAESTDAYIRRTDSGDFEIVPETLGDQFDQESLVKYVEENLELGMCKLKMEDSGCYEPYRAKTVVGDLRDELDLYNNFGKMTITFDFEDRTKTVTSDMIVSWLQLGDNGQVVKDEQGRIKFKWDDIAKFVDAMATETDTFGTDRSFYATVDGWITVPWVDSKSWDKNNCSNYGWKINRDETTQQIIDLIRAGETVKVEPIYYSWGKGYVRATDDIGDTYIEADISEQHFWVYKNGTVVMENDFVSGTETNWERRTPRGICQVLDMQAGKYLGTMEVQGYRCWVDYWMAFNNCGCGFHDLSRGAYGGSIYMYNGSHGCLNLKWSVAKELFNTISIGMPVIVHD